MPRAKPNWDWEPYEAVLSRDDLPDFVVAEIDGIVSFASLHERERFLNLCEMRAQEFIGMSRGMENLASTNQIVAAAEKIASESKCLAQKLPYCGGADSYFSDALIELSHTDGRYLGDSEEYLSDARRMLSDLGQVAELAAYWAREDADAASGSYDVKAMFARGLADAYRRSFDQEPRASVQRDYDKAHPYVRVLHVLYDYCTGRTHPLTAIEHIARKAF